MVSEDKKDIFKLKDNMQRAMDELVGKDKIISRLKDEISNLKSKIDVLNNSKGELEEVSRLEVLKLQEELKEKEKENGKIERRS